MRKLFQNFKKSESGASLVEYAVALIVVTIVGGAGVILIGQDSGTLATEACGVVEDAVVASTGAAGAGATC